MQSLSVFFKRMTLRLPMQRRLPLKNQILIVKQLSILLNSGISLAASLSLIKDSTASKAMRSVMEHISKQTENGQLLSSTLKKQKPTFDPIVIGMIAIGESSGSLDQNMTYAATALTKKRLLRQRLKSALIYPLLLVMATIIMTATLAFLVFPKITPVFKSIHYRLPLSTRLLIGVNDFVQAYWPFILLGLITVCILIFFAFKIEKVRFRSHELLFYIPGIRKLLQAYHIAGICRTLGIMLSHQAKILQAFHITLETTDNPIYQRELSILIRRLEQGESLAFHMKERERLFPQNMVQMVQMAENTGRLHEIFLYLASVLEEEMDEFTKNISAMVEPILLLCMGLLVGFVALSIITPMYGVTQYLKT